jgi:hypothetical protein
MRQRRIAIIGFALTVLGVFGARLEAQTSAGLTELGFLAGYFQSTESGSDGTLFANLRIGKFFTDGFQVGFGVQAAGTTDDLNTSTSGEVFATYHFSPEQTNSWYGRIGYFASFEDFGSGYGDLGIGFKSFLGENVAFFWEASYGEPIDSDVGDGIARSLAGISLFMGGPKP